MDNRLVMNMQPAEVFGYFEEISRIPHGSGNVKQISDYLVDFAKKHGLRYRQDEALNVIIFKDASKGYEDRPTVILQGHIDMVAVKTKESDKNLDTQGLELCYDGKYLYAKDTSLGADDGIAVAYALAILASENISHPALEAVFTTDEEIGMLGALQLDTDDIEGRIMLNIDSEEEGVILAGCAGGASVYADFEYESKNVSGVKLDIEVKGLTGGHSGVEIICQRCNSNVLVGRLLRELEIPYSIVAINGGEKDNAIANYTKLEIVIDKADVSLFDEWLKKFTKVCKNEYDATDADMDIEYVSAEYSGVALSDDAAARFEILFAGVPNGVVKMSNDVKGLVQTSLNLGILNVSANLAKICYSVRSAVASEKNELVKRIETIVKGLGGNVTISGVYPAWEYKKDSRLRNIMIDIYGKLFGKEPVIEIIHAGVECGVLADKLGELDCVSFGPQIYDIHTTREKLDVESAARTWEYILEILKSI